ncbi:hypothetical protein UNDKW_0088 [Undibacterium sp. KW1]|uniref:hypothetical protein n=1 Tax=Undibacterium sp. KW1 TaxID=2058624 RepID=UPI001331EE7D|nr:hypothetical protein [Undibacterium sp. KW1]BBB58361.1 hypothetical protein UNDKW_0088 [Undibacterium sp. KW1]
MKPAQQFVNAEMLLKLDPVADFALFQDCLPPMLRLQANLFGEHTPSEAEEAAAIENFRSLFSGAKTGFDRRKRDKSVPTVNNIKPNYHRRKSDGNAG